ncbi:MAG: hypothetical protein V3V31_03770 [Methylococcales bacterium]
MKPDGYFLWKSPLMEIVSAEERISKSTEKPYMVVKAKMVFSGNPVRRGGKKRSEKNYAMMCFSGPLFALFETGNQHLFEGELSFDWGNTWLKITKLYDSSGNRLLRPAEIQEADKLYEKISEAVVKNIGAYVTQKTEIKPFERDDLSCVQKCWECDHRDCDFFIPY